MTDMHFDTAMRIAKELYKSGMDLTDIWIVGQNMQVITKDSFWSRRVEGRPASTKEELEEAAKEQLERSKND